MSPSELAPHIDDPEERYVVAGRMLAEIRRRTLAAQQPDERTKRCPGCGLTKPIDAFGINSTRQDGRQIYCKPCRLPKGEQ